MPFFKLSAEHITRSKGDAIYKHADEVMGLNVLHVGHDDIFTDLFHIVVECSQAEVNQLREFMWEKNRGAYCEVVKDWVEDMDDGAGWL